MPLSDIDDFAALVENIEKDLLKPRDGEFCPGDWSPILVPNKIASSEPSIHLARWGFPVSGSSKLLINARAETVHDKPLFRIPFQSKRCLVPSRGFFEWDKGRGTGATDSDQLSFLPNMQAPVKMKYHFFWPDQSWMWFGGIYWFFQDASGITIPAYTILTTEANGDISDIHDRMPIIIQEPHKDIWLYEKNIGTVQELLKPLPDGSLVRKKCA